MNDKTFAKTLVQAGTPKRFFPGKGVSAEVGRT
jgi:hypothetical protein